MHFAPFDNRNKPIVDVDDARVPLNYFNIVKLKAGQAFEYRVPGYETCVVPATGRVDITIGGEVFNGIGNRVVGNNAGDFFVPLTNQVLRRHERAFVIVERNTAIFQPRNMAVDHHHAFGLFGKCDQLFIGQRFGVNHQRVTAVVDQQFN